MCDGTHATPEGTNKLLKEVAEMPMVPTFVMLLSLSQPTLMASWKVPCDQLTEEGKTNLVYR